jgi:hypothetical protein
MKSFIFVEGHAVDLHTLKLRVYACIREWYCSPVSSETQPLCAETLCYNFDTRPPLSSHVLYAVVNVLFSEHVGNRVKLHMLHMEYHLFLQRTIHLD